MRTTCLARTLPWRTFPLGHTRSPFSRTIPARGRACGSGPGRPTYSSIGPSAVSPSSPRLPRTTSAVLPSFRRPKNPIAHGRTLGLRSPAAARGVGLRSSGPGPGMQAPKVGRGNCWFPTARVIGHRLARELMLTRVHERLEAARDHNRELRDVTVVPPEITLDGGSLSIRIGKRTLQLIPLPGHSPDGIGALVLEDRVLFSGDAMMPVPYLVAGDS